VNMGRVTAHLSPLITKLIKCHFKVGSEPLWAWVCRVFDGQNAINELMKCVLAPFGLSQGFIDGLEVLTYVQCLQVFKELDFPT